MTVDEAYKRLKKLVDDGHGDAILYHMDTRSGVAEECHMSSSVEIDVELASGEHLEKGLPIYEN